LSRERTVCEADDRDEKSRDCERGSNRIARDLGQRARLRLKLLHDIVNATALANREHAQETQVFAQSTRLAESSVEPIVLLFVRLIVSVFNNCIHHLASSNPLIASDHCPCAGVGACAFAGLCSAIKTMKTMTQIKVIRIKFPTDLTTQSPGLSVP